MENSQALRRACEQFRRSSNSILNALREKKGRQLTQPEIKAVFNQLQEYAKVCDELLASADQKSQIKSMDPNLRQRLEEFLATAGAMQAKSRTDAASPRSAGSTLGEGTASAPGLAHETPGRATWHHFGDAEAPPSDHGGALDAWYEAPRHRHRCKHFVSRETCPAPSCTWRQNLCQPTSPRRTGRPAAGALAALALAGNVLHPQAGPLTPPGYYPAIGGHPQQLEPFIKEIHPGYPIFYHGTRWD